MLNYDPFDQIPDECDHFFHYHYPIPVLDDHFGLVEENQNFLTDDDLFEKFWGPLPKAIKSQPKNETQEKIDEKKDEKKDEIKTKAQEIKNEEKPQKKVCEKSAPKIWGQTRIITSTARNDGVIEIKEKTYDCNSGEGHESHIRRIGDRWCQTEVDIDKDGITKNKETWHNVAHDETDSFKKEWEEKTQKKIKESNEQKSIKNQ